MIGRKKEVKSSGKGTADLSKGFHPEIMFLINRPYAEYVDYKEE
jgi:hypothetical protein